MKKANIIVLLVILISACAPAEYDRYPTSSSSRIRRSVPPQGVLAGQGSAESKVPTAVSLPFETWPIGKDLQGNPISQPLIAEGDSSLIRGDREKALKEYQSLKSQELTPALQEALAIRLGSTYLALDKASLSLSTMSKYLRERVGDPSAVDPRFALIFGYAYGRLRDLDQSAAWFVEAAKGVAVRNQAETGTARLLRTVSNEELDQLEFKWREANFVRTLIAQERKYRTISGHLEEVKVQAAKLWDVPLAQDPDISPGDIQSTLVPSGAQLNYTIGVHLPLSGRYGGLGRSVKNGIELALEGSGQASGVKLAVKDSAILDAGASASLEELVYSERPNVIIGPLLSEDAVAVAEMAKNLGVPIVTFSKNSSFRTGGGIFRLGATVESQVQSLLLEASNKLKITRLALVYPADLAGQEFAEALRRFAPANGIEIAYETSYPKGDNDALIVVADALSKQSDLQAVFVADGLLNASRLVAAFSNELRDNIRILGPLNWDDPFQLANSRAALDGAVFVSPFFKQSARPEVKLFIDKFKEKYGQNPDFLAAQGYDAANLVLAGLNQQASGAASFEMALGSVPEHNGLTGLINVDPIGELRRKFTVVQYRDGQIAPLESPATPEFVLKGNERLNKQTGVTDGEEIRTIN